MAYLASFIAFHVKYKCNIFYNIATLVCSPTGSLLNLAKHPSSTVQILGAEKALFRLVEENVMTNFLFVCLFVCLSPTTGNVLKVLQ